MSVHALSSLGWYEPEDVSSNHKYYKVIEIESTVVRVLGQSLRDVRHAASSPTYRGRQAAATDWRRSSLITPLSCHGDVNVSATRNPKQSHQE